MKINVHCLQCTEKEKGFVPGRVPFSDDLVLEFACPNGHRTLISIQAHRFDALISVATDALIDECHMEAVSSFNSALERFYEFYLEYRALCSGLPVADYAKVWKLLSNQSERQLGAFILEFLLHKKHAPDLIHEKKLRPGITCVQFRNNVIHKGYYPTYDEALSFGQHVLDFIVPILEAMKQERPDIVVQMIRNQVADTEKARERRFRDGSFSGVYGLLPRVFVSAVQTPGMVVPTLPQEIQNRKIERARSGRI